MKTIKQLILTMQYTVQRITSRKLCYYNAQKHLELMTSLVHKKKILQRQ